MIVKVNEPECIRLEGEAVEEGVWKIVDLIPDGQSELQVQPIDHEFKILSRLRRFRLAANKNQVEIKT